MSSGSAHEIVPSRRVGKFCPNCGMNVAQAKFCPEDGTRHQAVELPNHAAMSPSVPQQESSQAGPSLDRRADEDILDPDGQNRNSSDAGWEHKSGRTQEGTSGATAINNSSSSSRGDGSGGGGGGLRQRRNREVYQSQRGKIDRERNVAGSSAAARGEQAALRGRHAHFPAAVTQDDNRHDDAGNTEEDRNGGGEYGDFDALEDGFGIFDVTNPILHRIREEAGMPQLRATESRLPFGDRSESGVEVDRAAITRAMQEIQMGGGLRGGAAAAGFGVGAGAAAARGGGVPSVDDQTLQELLRGRAPPLGGQERQPGVVGGAGHPPRQWLRRWFGIEDGDAAKYAVVLIFMIFIGLRRISQIVQMFMGETNSDDPVATGQAADILAEQDEAATAGTRLVTDMLGGGG